MSCELGELICNIMSGNCEANWSSSFVLFFGDMEGVLSWKQSRDFWKPTILVITFWWYLTFWYNLQKPLISGLRHRLPNNLRSRILKVVLEINIFSIAWIDSNGMIFVETAGFSAKRVFENSSYMSFDILRKYIS